MGGRGLGMRAVSQIPKTRTPFPLPQRGRVGDGAARRSRASTQAANPHPNPSPPGKGFIALRHKALALPILLALATVGCKAPAPEPAATQTAAATVHPASGLKVIPLTVTHNGKPHNFKAELAQTPAEQAKGLMFRTALGPDEAMLFPFDPPKQASFWMRNTVIPLDLLFIASDGRVTNIAANAKPYDESKLESDGVVKAVLEIPGGRAKELGLAAGDVVGW